MNLLFELNEGEGTDNSNGSDNVSRDGFNGLCDLCDFFISCRSDYDEVKKGCDEHNRKNPGHNAAPINCTL